MTYKPAGKFDPSGQHPDTTSQNPADFTTDQIETYTLGAPPVWGGQGQHPIADHIFNILANRGNK